MWEKCGIGRNKEIYMRLERGKSYANIHRGKKNRGGWMGELIYMNGSD